ncbi:unnamed protein product [Vicia faba]|uniref:Uncharacterized protein n=1 Tax=Vicia faba TaxID=3906 RepID=A0AAV0ZDB9_VICFA|nr:unnamed protein product [Vicia faba]
MQKSLMLSKKKIAQARENLEKAQINLSRDIFNRHLIEGVKNCTEELIRWNDTEIAILRQRANISWLKDGDGNSSFFHAFVKAKKKSGNLNMLLKEVLWQLLNQILRMKS